MRHSTVALKYRSRRLVAAAGAFVIVALGSAIICRADEVVSLSADKLKAAYIFNFAKFVEWPDSGSADDLVMCFIGAPGVYDLLSHGVAGTMIGRRRVAVRSFEAAEQSDACTLLYVDASVPSLSQIMSRASSHALTVSDQPEFIRHGGTIEIFADGNRLRFNINLGNARLARVRISSQLLQLASRVEQE